MHTPTPHILFPTHLTHVAPPAPHAPFAVPARQMSSSQQPGQLVGVHLHLPPTHASPEPQAAEVPHWQTPEAAQLSAEALEQTRQVAPWAPQVEIDFVVHAFPAQQPAAHEVASQLHTPARQR